MKANLRNLFYIFIIISLLKNEVTKGKVCHSGNFFANWNLTFVDSVTKDYFPTEIYVYSCHSSSISFCSQIQHIRKPLLTGNDLTFSRNVGKGLYFDLKIKVFYSDKIGRKFNCYFWSKEECASCKKKELIPCSYKIDLYRSSAGGGKCTLINQS